MAPPSEVVRIGGLELRFLVDETQGSGAVVMFEMTVPPQARAPVPHYHKDVDEIVYGLEGTLDMRLDGEVHEIRRGDSLFVPRGSLHGFENPHPETARTLAVLTPGSIGRRYFEEIAAEINGPHKPDLAKVKAIMIRHGLVPV